MTDKLQRGTQIVYIPNHADGDIYHPDVEHGFITSGPTLDGAYFCRYWSKGHLGEDIRTKSCSELTPGKNIRVMEIANQEKVQEMLERYC